VLHLVLCDGAFCACEVACLLASIASYRLRVQYLRVVFGHFSFVSNDALSAAVISVKSSRHVGWLINLHT